MSDKNHTLTLKDIVEVKKHFDQLKAKELAMLLANIDIPTAKKVIEKGLPTTILLCPGLENMKFVFTQYCDDVRVIPQIENQIFFSWVDFTPLPW
jgi:hypothetical protein